MRCTAEQERPVLPILDTENVRLPEAILIGTLTAGALHRLGCAGRRDLQDGLLHQRGQHLHVLWSHDNHDG